MRRSIALYLIKELVLLLGAKLPRNKNESEELI